MTSRGWLGLCLVLLPLGAFGEEDATLRASPRTTTLELKLGSYTPRIDQESGLGGATPFSSTYGGGLLLGELELDHHLFQAFGTAAVGLSVGYGEKFGRATVVGTGESSTEMVGFKVLPLKVWAVYRLDYFAFHHNIPLVPYLKVGLAHARWWATKGGAIETVEVTQPDGSVTTVQGFGGKWGYAGVAGLSFLLDVLEPRLAKDGDSDIGINHSYLFAEYVYEELDDFGGNAFNLGSRRWMFGLALEL